MKRLLILVALGVLAGTVLAVSVTPSQATRAAQAWMGAGSRLGARLGTVPRRTSTLATTNGVPFYAVTFDRGTVITSGDTEDAPVIAFTSSTNDLSHLDATSPLGALLLRDSAARAAARARGPVPGATAAWQRLVAQPATASGASISSETDIDDVRVSPLVQSTWDQTTAGGQPCYNYYTPNHTYCGCVATAMAQLMRYHAWPQAEMSPVTRTCYVDASVAADGTRSGATNLTTLAGTYDWTNMPLRPSGTLAEGKRAAIGKLCYDAGVSVYMQYASDGSGAFMFNILPALKKNFGYASTQHFYQGDFDEVTAIPGALEGIIFANLDAAYPVLLGIVGTTTQVGHAIVADGYGYVGTTPYVHLNMGWSGSCDYWYNLPDIGTGYRFDVVDEVLFNIFPTGGATDSVLSGRVLDVTTESPVSNVTVSITAEGASEPYTNVITSASGIYAAVLPAKTYTVQIEAEGWQRARKTVTLAATFGRTSYVTAPIVENADYPWEVTYAMNNCVQVGNSWGNDFKLVPSDAPPRTALHVDASAVSGLLADGSEDYPFETINAALTNAWSGDTILVAPGTYYEMVEAPDNLVTIRATEGPGATIIDADYPGCYCCYDGSANEETLLAGFTLQNGDCCYGGGAYCGTLSNCVVRNCVADYGGGAYYATLINCLVVSNQAYGHGGGAYECALYSSTLVGNRAGWYGGGALLYDGFAVNTLVASNTSDRGYDYGNDVYGSAYWTMVASLSDEDAKFVDAENGDFHLLATSPALNAGSNAFVSVATDLDGNGRIYGPRVDIGCYEYCHEPAGWPVTTNIAVGASADDEAAAVREALMSAGFPAATASAVTTQADYLKIAAWAEANGVAAADEAKSPTALLSPALDAEGLVDLSSNRLTVAALTLATNATSSCVMTLELPFDAYDAAKADLSLLKAAIGVTGAAAVTEAFTADDLTVDVAKGTNGVTVTVEPPAGAPAYFLEATVR